MKKITNAYIKKAPLKELLELTSEDLAPLNQKEYLTLERKLRAATKRRFRNIEKGLGGEFKAFALEKYMGGELPEVATKAASRQRLQHLVVAYQELLKAESSTLTGMKRILKAEEARIFDGEKGFETGEQRRRFWSAYMEFRNDHADVFSKYGSTRVQQAIASETFWRRKGFTAYDLERISVGLKTGKRIVDLRKRFDEDDF